MSAPSSLRQDVLSEHETVLVELADGTRLVEIVDPDAYRDRYSYRIDTPDESHAVDDERRAKLWASLYALVDGFEPAGSRTRVESIPLAVALEGKPAIASYLYAVNGLGSKQVADLLDVRRRTIWDYFSRLRHAADSFD